MRQLVWLAVAVMGAGIPVTAAEAQLGRPLEGGDSTVVARLIDADGTERGAVVLRQTPGHGLVLEVTATGLEPGTHAIHIHETGACRAPDFSSAGGHFDARGRSHGLMHPRGPHAGDMLNLHVPASGEVRAERLAPHASLQPGTPGYLFDDDGSAVVIHAGADDYRSQPSGDAGGRALCGVVHR